MLEFTKFSMGFSFAEGKNQYAICENSHNRRDRYYYLIVNGKKQNTRADLNSCIKLANEIENQMKDEEKINMKNYIRELLLEDNENMTVESINYYINEIVEELKFCKITQKSVEEISLHEFECCSKNWKGIYENYFVLSVTIIYNGDFEHQFNIVRKE